MKDKQEKKSKTFLKESILTLFYAIIFTFVVRTLLYDPYHIPSSSMTPTLLTGDKIFVSKFFYGYSEYSIPFHPISVDGRFFSHRKPHRGDVVVFTTPANPSTFFVKRVIGIPGDKIEIKNNKVYLNDKPFEYSFVKRIPSLTDKNENMFSVYEYVELNNDRKYYSIYVAERDNSPNKTYIVPEGNYFMMGDNRANSGDSRFENMGYIPFENIIGRAEMIFFSTTGSQNTLPTGIRSDRIFQTVAPKRLATTEQAIENKDNDPKVTQVKTA